MDETIWATQKALTELFGVDRTSISRHLKNIFETQELDEKVVSAEIAQTTRHGAIEGKTQTKGVKFYNLDAIISVGYRVNSAKATKFRIWATDILKEYIQKGYKIDVERMKQGETVFEKDYFRELLETVRSIRASLLSEVKKQLLTSYIMVISVTSLLLWASSNDSLSCQRSCI